MSVKEFNAKQMTKKKGFLNFENNRWQFQKKEKKKKTTGGVVGSARELVLRTHVTRSELSSSVRQGKD